VSGIADRGVPEMRGNAPPLVNIRGARVFKDTLGMLRALVQLFLSFCQLLQIHSRSMTPADIVLIFTMIGRYF
jgi:hypothetical protein